MLLYIITNAVLFSFLLTHENIPQAMAAWMIDQNLSVILFLLAVNILLLLAGNVMEPSSITLIVAPLLFPIAMKLGIDPIHFGAGDGERRDRHCATAVGLEPLRRARYYPYGNSGLLRRPIAGGAGSATMLIFLVLVTYWPTLSLWLPRALGMM